MAVGLRIKLEGMTQEQYDAVNDAAMVDGKEPEGLLVHSAGPIEGGWGVIDFWESREQFDTFLETQLAPAMAGLDSPPTSPPDVKQFEVYNLVKL